MTIDSQIKQTLATLKGAQGTLRTYYTQEQDEDAKATFVNAIFNTERIIKDLEERLKKLELEEPQYKGY